MSCNRFKSKPQADWLADHAGHELVEFDAADRHQGWAKRGLLCKTCKHRYITFAGPDRGRSHNIETPFIPDAP